MTHLHDKALVTTQPLFTAALRARIHDAAGRLDGATRRGDALLTQIFAGELADLQALAAANDIHVPAP